MKHRWGGGGEPWFLISDNRHENDRKKQPHGFVLRRTESGQNNRTSIGCNVEGGGVDGNQGTE